MSVGSDLEKTGTAHDPITKLLAWQMFPCIFRRVTSLVLLILYSSWDSFEEVNMQLMMLRYTAMFLLACSSRERFFTRAAARAWLLLRATRLPQTGLRSNLSQSDAVGVLLL